MSAILGFLGLVLNLIGTVIVSVSAKNVMTCIHTVSVRLRTPFTLMLSRDIRAA